MGFVADEVLPEFSEIAGLDEFWEKRCGDSRTYQSATLPVCDM